MVLSTNAGNYVDTNYAIDFQFYVYPSRYGIGDPVDGLFVNLKDTRPTPSMIHITNKRYDHTDE
jgi:hypothetical protein